MTQLAEQRLDPGMFFQEFLFFFFSHGAFPFILHSSQPAAARLCGSAAESIVRWEPGYTHRPGCSLRVSTASRASPRLSVAAVGMMHRMSAQSFGSFLKAFCSSNQTKRAFSVAQSSPLSSACARLPLIRLIRRSAQRWFQGSSAGGPTVGPMLTNAVEPAGSVRGTCLHVGLWCGIINTHPSFS